MKKILLDTNFFITPFQISVNIFSEFDRIMEEPFQLVTLSTVKAELEKIAKSPKANDRAAANLAIHLARNIEVIDFPGRGDDAILDYAKSEKDVIVATNDSELRKRLKASKIRTIYVRGRGKLEIA